MSIFKKQKSKSFKFFIQKFLSFNNIPHPHRIELKKFLTRTNYIDDGWFTFESESENGIKVKGTFKLQIEDKQGKVFTTIYFEVAYAPVDLNTYVYLKQIIEKIKITKLKDIDASLKSILSEL